MSSIVASVVNGVVMKSSDRAYWALIPLFFLVASQVSAQDSVWPENWTFFPKGKGERVYRLDEDATSGTRVLQVVANKDVGSGSLLIDVPMPLTELTTLKWRWNVHSIPSKVAEDTELTHQYLAIAIMFDNDQVLSYMWSSTLPAGMVFQCPQTRWKDRETHLVMYSGAAQLGQWLTEERHLLSDYARLKSGAPPKAIKQVWFIAGAGPEGGSGDVSYSDVSLGDKSDDRRKIFSQRGLSQRDKDIAAINATLPGQWTGFIETDDMGTGKLARNKLAMSFATISKDKLDYAYWGPRGFTLARYEEDGKYQLQQWPFAGEPSTIEYQVTAVTPPDATGNWSTDEIISAPDAGDTVQRWHQQWSFKDGELRVAKDKPQTGATVASPWTRGYRIKKIKSR
jgi:hypothetical protein